MTSRYLGVIILSLFLTVRCGTAVVQWSISLPSGCMVNNTMLGQCTRSRTVQCIETESGQHIPDYYCHAVSTKPVSFIHCDTQKCPGRCVVSMWSPWQPCDVACSRSFTYRTRSILWRDNEAITCPPLLEKSPCAQCGLNSNVNEFFLWRVGDWGTCRAMAMITVYDLSANQSQASPSGSDVCRRHLKLGKTTRKVKCVDVNGVEQKARKCLNSKDKDGRITQRPDRSKVCQFPCDCHVSEWSAWSGCPVDCTEESRTRGVLFPPQLGGKPCESLVEKRACNTQSCPRYKWYIGSWGECRSEGSSVNGSACGNGFQERVVFCIEKEKVSAMQPVTDYLCDVATRPVTGQLCQTPCLENCMVSSWNEWEACSVSCDGPGMKKRERSVVQMAKHGGMECPSLVQMSQCQVPPCASWRTHFWGRCYTTGRCGAGMSTRLVYCAGSGTWLNQKACSQVPKPLGTQNCTVPCPNDCVLSVWGSWGACSKSCGEQGGLQTRRRSILAYPSTVRPPCPSSSELTETQKCNVGKFCGNEMSYMWRYTMWSPCEEHVNGTCGVAKGVQKREVYCGNDLKNFSNDTLCLNMSKPAVEKICDIPCPKNCLLSKWENWSKCNGTCKSEGTEVSKRYILQNAEYGGLPCPQEATNGVEIKVRACLSTEPCYNYNWTVTPWQDCKILPHSKSIPPTCGSGYQTRNISCVRSDGEHVETSYCFLSSLEIAPKTLRECWKPCDDYCVRSSWSEWSKCPNRCTQTLSVRERSRQVVNLSPARGGFSATCPPLTAIDFTETEDCPKVPCKSYKWYVAPFASCIPLNSVTSCGQGRRERHVLCQDQSDLSIVAETFCDTSIKPIFWEDCLVECTQDCVVSAWGKWNQICSNTCGDSLRTRQRTVLKQRLGLGRACPSLVDKQLCRELPCTSYEWSTSVWSTCKLASKGLCGNGTQIRYVTCSPDPAKEWICLKQAPKPVTVQDCSLACPGDCVVSPWSEWSKCVQGRNGCSQIRWRDVVRTESRTSTKKCKDYSDKEMKNCSCPLAGKLVIGEWSTCQLSLTLGPGCGKGMQYRSVKCEGDNGIVLDNTRCPNSASTLRLRGCELPCPVDCAVGNWGDWSRCTNACGLDGKIQRTRKVITAEQNGGRRCPHVMQYKPCNGMPCYTYSLDYGAWSKCYVDGRGCGQGSQTRETKCRRSDGDIVSLYFCFGQLKKSSDTTVTYKILRDVINNSSQLSLTSSRSCDVPCPGDCFMSEWSEWSKCGKTCFGNSTKYEQKRTRVVILSAVAGGKACSSDLVQTQTCQPVTTQCVGARWKTAAWQGNGTRAIWCETSNGVRATGACATQNKPSDIMACKPTCSDPNSVCHEGRCICKPNYELFQHQCIPALGGCLNDGHCLVEHMVCEKLMCKCKSNYIWNLTAVACVELRNQPTTAFSTNTGKPTTSTSDSFTKTEEQSTTISTSIMSKSPKKDDERIENTSTKESPTSIEVLKMLEATTPENPDVKERVEEEETISPGFWKWIGIGAGALAFFILLAIGAYCYTRRQRKAKHKMLKLKRNTIELVGVMTFEHGEKGKPEKV